MTLILDFQFPSQSCHRGRSLTLAGQALPLRLILNHIEKSSQVFPGEFVSQWGEEGTVNTKELPRDQARAMV